jgi:MoxR-like ATPase
MRHAARQAIKRGNMYRRQFSSIGKETWMPAKSITKTATVREDARATPRVCPFRALGLRGLGHIAPVLVAALATEEPLLLIGPHGTAKTLLLIRIASALDLRFRHYNASLLNFDDLVGFPLPGKDGGLDYAKTPAAIWGAGAVIFDEIGRCRPDIQNKLFPIIHERKVQGLALEGLRFRWAAMNPPSSDEAENGYAGSEPLDAALADRFAFVVEMPGWERLSEAEQLAVIRADDAPVGCEAAQALVEALERTRDALPAMRTRLAEGIANYVRALVALARQADLQLSPRRAGMLFRSILAVNAAALAIDPATRPSEIALLAVTNGLPQRAQGIAIPEAKLLAAHREAWRLANVGPNDPLRAILCTADPLERFRLAVACAALPKGELSGIVADTLAQLRPGARDAAIVHLFETGVAGRLNAAVAEQAAEIYRTIATPQVFSETLYGADPRFQTWNRIKNLLARLDPADAQAHLKANALAASFARKELATPGDAEAAERAFDATQSRLRSAHRA